MLDVFGRLLYGLSFPLVDMRISAPVLALASAVSSTVGQTMYNVSSSAPKSAGSPFSEAFVSYSIELSSFPDFAGNISAPNTFSYTLLTNLGSIIGTKPIIRVGGKHTGLCPLGRLPDGGALRDRQRDAVPRLPDDGHHRPGLL